MRESPREYYSSAGGAQPLVVARWAAIALPDWPSGRLSPEDHRGRYNPTRKVIASSFAGESFFRRNLALVDAARYLTRPGDYTIFNDVILRRHHGSK
jgi:hypothetical protein